MIHNRKAFTLVEMLIVCVLLSLVFIAAFGLFGSVIKGQYSQITTTVLYNTATAIDSAIANAIEGATYVPTPSSVSGASALEMWAGISALDQTQLSCGANPCQVSFTYFCSDANDNLWMYQGLQSGGTSPTPPVGPSIANCGKTVAIPNATVALTELAGGSMSIRTVVPSKGTCQAPIQNGSLQFKRLSTNQVQVTYALYMPPNARIQSSAENCVFHSTVFQLQEGNL